MKVALAHDWLTNMGGAEKVAINFKDIYPDAPIYTISYNPDNLSAELKNIDVRTSFIHRFFKKSRNNHQKYLPFMPLAWEQFNFNEYDIVLSSSSSCAKGLVTSPDTMHVCYCHTPMRYAWEFYYEYLDTWQMSKTKKLIMPLFMNYLRLWDTVTSNRVDYFIANSQNVARRIWKHYRRSAEVIHPPVKASFFNVSNNSDDYFLVVSRLVPYKKVDLAVETFNELGLPLIVVGTGPQYEYLRKIARSNVKIVGSQPDEVIKKYYAECRAFLFPGEEDFGITPLEAQASGRPVIAFGKGGALETVIDNVTGVFFEEQTISSFKESVTRFQALDYDKNKIRKHALSFDEEVFKQKIKSFVDEKYSEYKSNILGTGKVYSNV